MLEPKKLTNLIGKRGETAFFMAITNYRDFDAPLFEPGFLGEKFPVLDHLILLNNVEGAIPYFLGQVKSTAEPLPELAKRLPITATKEECMRLYELPGPTYIFGVHDHTGRVFVHSVHEEPERGVYGIATANELHSGNLLKLYNEVKEFWSDGDWKPTSSVFL